MQINPNKLNKRIQNTQKKQSESDSVFSNIKDVLSFRNVKNETVSIFTAYKNLKLDQLKDRKEPWWVELSDGLQIQGDIIRGLGITGTGLMASTIASGIGAIGVGAVGIKDFKKGIQEKDGWKAVEGTTALLASFSGTACVIGNTLKSHKPGGTAGIRITGIAESAGTVLGVAYGVGDVVLGSRELISGIKEKNKDSIVDGSLEIGIGSAYIMSSLGVIGGPVSAVALGGLYTTKLIYDYRDELAGLGKKILNKVKGEE
ncbi:MAG TPA: hypothetical protein PL110_08120 [Candidatus Eremiobacteraeota bacterium]|nr:MAG: hypothetical protein BWY64_01996 [bacterium ADurb.Bin363]HPZ08065.1 hypothetical protein [Candidatus Eremiobacteraeota bacterium]